MDSCFRIPGTRIRFGFDTIIGLIPGVGDTVTLLIGAVMLAEARRLNLGFSVMAKMAGNLLFDWFMGLLPGVDLIVDTAIKAHTKNALLLADSARRNPPHDVTMAQTTQSNTVDPACLH